MSDQELTSETATCDDNDGDSEIVVDSTADKTSIGFSDAGKKVASRTTDLIAMAIVLIGTLIAAERLMKWWADDGSNASANQQLSAIRGLDPRWDINGTPVDIDLGELPFTLHRQYFQGDEESVIGAMSRICTEFADRVSSDALPPEKMLQSEQVLLKRLSSLKPILEADGKWRLYRAPGLLPSVVVVHPKSQLSEQQEHSLSNWSVSAWAFAYPFGKSSWLSFAFLKSASDTVGLPNLPSIDLPRNTSRVLTVRAERAGSMMSFRAPMAATIWARQMSEIAEASGWKLITLKNKGTLTRQYQLKSDGRTLRMDFQVEDDSDGQCYGMLNLMLGGP